MNRDNNRSQQKNTAVRGDIMEKRSGNVIFMPDIEYRAWVNDNRTLLEEILKTGKVSTLWLAKDNNKAHLVRYFKECGYVITID